VTLPNLDSEFCVRPSIIRRYRRQGHVIVRGLATREELEPYRVAISALAGQAPASEYFIRIIDAWRCSDPARRLVFARRFAGVAAQLLGVPAVRLFYDQVLFKLAGSGRTAWHTDRPYFKIAKDHALTMWLPLADVPKSMGPICFASRSQEGTGTDDDAWVGSSRAHTARISRRWPIFTESLRVGDASFHGTRVLHSAGPNRSKKIRETMTIVYYPAALANSGEEANDELHPILYR
jgi:ectoine hydroxylase-related dioxygenase (phytanoyl-CoA dioxygenase family)